MRQDLDQWLRFVLAETHVLRVRPWLLFQQAANQPDSTLPAQTALAQSQERTAPHAWLSWRTKSNSLVPLLHTIEGHSDSVTGCLIDRSTDRIVSAGRDGKVALWNATTGSQLALLAQFSSDFVTVALSGVAGRIVAGSGDGFLKIWETATGAESFNLQLTSAIVGCAFSSDGGRVTAALKNGVVKTWNGETAEVLSELKLNVDPPGLCVVNPGATRILWLNTNTARLFNAETGNLVATLDGYGGILCASFSADGTRLVTATDEDRLVIWNALTGELVHNFIRHMSFMIYASVVEPQHFSACAFSPDGCSILTGSQRGTLKLWSSTTGEQVATFDNNSTIAISCCVFSQEGLSFLTGSRDGSLRLWDAGAGTQTPGSSEVFSEEVTCLITSSDGAYFLAATSMLSNYSTTGTVKFVDAESGRLVRGAFALTQITSCGFRSTEEVIILYHSGDLYSWSVGLDGHPKSLEIKLDSHAVSACSADSSQLLTGTREGQLTLWNARNGRRTAESKRQSHAITACTFSPDGQIVLAGYDDGTVELRSSKLTDQPRARFVLPAAIRCCAFSQDQSRMAAGSADGMLHIRSVAEPTRLIVIEATHACLAVAFSPDGECLAAGYSDGWMSIRNIETGRVISESGLGTEVTAIAWSKNAESIAAGTACAEVHVFHLRDFR